MKIKSKTFKILVAAVVLHIISLAPASAQSQRTFAIDVYGGQGSDNTPPTQINWTSVKNGGISFAWTKAAEATAADGYNHPSDDFIANENNGKAAGVYMGAYYFAHPELDSPGVAAASFWSAAGSYILADGKTLMPMLDMEVFTAHVGATSYSDWANQWCNAIVADAAAVGVSVKPMIYVSACNVVYFDSSVSQWIPWIADYNDPIPQSGTPWNTCNIGDVWGSGVWSVWQYTSTGSVSGITGNVDEDVFNGSSTTMISMLVAASASTSAPAAPVATAATSVTSGGFQANWNSVSGATGYQFDCATSSAFTTFITLNLDEGNFLYGIESGLSPNTTYYYRVRAYNAAGTSGNSSTISVTTTGIGGSSAPVISNPKLNGTTFTLSIPTEIGTNYVLEYKNSISDPIWTPLQTNGGNGSIMNLTNLGTIDPIRFYQIRLQ
jgi:GH25 family lysozyme M1 (1,4-beta-N-acetylmuramidase)